MPIPSTKSANALSANCDHRLTIQIVNSPVSAGKTYSAVEHAIKRASFGDKVLICQPSKLLIKETVALIRKRLAYHKLSVPFDSIYSDNDGTPCLPDINKHFREADPDKGEILLITHQAFMRLDYIHNAHKWHLIVDEIPQTDWCDVFHYADHKDELATLFTSYECPDDPTYNRLIGENCDILDEIIENPNEDEVHDRRRDLAARLRSDHQIVKAEYEMMKDFFDDKRKSITFFAMMQPSIFRKFASVTVMGACLNESVMYNAWRHEVDFIEHPHIKPRFNVHLNGHLVEIYYAFDYQSWSKRKRDTTVEHKGADTKLIDIAVKLTNDLFAGERSVIFVNKDKTDIVAQITGAEQLPNSPHGLNKYQDRHNVAIFSALNPPSEHFVFLKNMADLDPTESANAIYRVAAYQAVGRISIRDTTNTETKRVVVMDKGTAEWLAKLFPGAKVLPLPGAIDVQNATSSCGRPRVHESDNDRKRTFQEKQKAKLLAQLEEINSQDCEKEFNEINELSVEKPDDENPIEKGLRHLDSDLIRVQEYRAYPSKKKQSSVVPKKKDENMAPTLVYEPLPYFECDCSKAEFVEYLRLCHAQTHQHKFDAKLISPAYFDPSLSAETDRGKENIVYVQGIWLDNDYDEVHGNGISPQDFMKAFPDVKMYVFNSYSNRSGCQKYRVYIPVQQRMALEIYEFLVVKGIMKKLADNRGYRSKTYFDRAVKDKRQHSYKFDGFDQTKFVPSSLFFLPSQAAGGPAYTFWLEQNTDKPDLDVAAWIDKTSKTIQPPPETPQTPVQTPIVANPSPNASPGLKALQTHLASQQAATAQAIKDKARDTAIANWRNCGAGNGNRAFFDLARSLKYNGHTPYEIEMVLRAEAHNARSPTDRRNEIPNIMRHLK